MSPEKNLNPNSSPNNKKISIKKLVAEQKASSEKLPPIDWNTDQIDAKERRRILLLANELADFIIYLHSPWRIVWANFFGGVLRGLGIIIGMTLVFAVLIWVLSQFVNFPLIGEYFQILRDMLQNFQPQKMNELPTINLY